MVETIIGILATATCGALGWIFSLGNRVTILETKEPDLRELINIKFDAMDKRLGRIEVAMNGHLKDKV